MVVELLKEREILEIFLSECDGEIVGGSNYGSEFDYSESNSSNNGLFGNGLFFCVFVLIFLQYFFDGNGESRLV